MVLMSYFVGGGTTNTKVGASSSSSGPSGPSYSQVVQSPGGVSSTGDGGFVDKVGSTQGGSSIIRGLLNHI